MDSTEEITLAGQVAALIEAVGGWQVEVLKALQDAIAAAGGVDQTQLITIVNNHLAAPDTLAALIAAIMRSDQTAQQIEQLIEQYSAADVTDAVRAVLLSLPDTSAATGTGMADVYSIGQLVTYTPQGATTPTGTPVTWHLSELVGISASTTEIQDGSSAQLTITGTGSMSVTAVSNGISADPIRHSWTASAAVIAQPRVTSPAAGTTGLALQPVITASAYSVSPSGYDTHQRSQCRVLNSSGAVLWDSGMVSARTEFAVDSDLAADTVVDIQVRYEGSRLGWGQWSPSVRVTTRQAGGLGVVYPDGGIGGPVVGGYRLIVAPASRRGRDIRHGLYLTDTPLQDIVEVDVRDPRSGYDNTDVLISGYGHVYDGYVRGPAAAQFCRDQGPGWYLPSREELIAIVAMSDEIDTADNTSGVSFASMWPGSIWSSTEAAGRFSWTVRSYDGRLERGERHYQRFVVPVRREPV